MFSVLRRKPARLTRRRRGWDSTSACGTCQFTLVPGPQPSEQGWSMCNFSTGRLLCFRRKHLDRAGATDPAAWIWNRFRWSPEIWAVAAPDPPRLLEECRRKVAFLACWACPPVPLQWGFLVVSLVRVYWYLINLLSLLGSNGEAGWWL